MYSRVSSGFQKPRWSREAKSWCPGWPVCARISWLHLATNLPIWLAGWCHWGLGWLWITKTEGDWQRFCLLGCLEITCAVRYTYYGTAPQRAKALRGIRRPMGGAKHEIIYPGFSMFFLVHEHLWSIRGAFMERLWFLIHFDGVSYQTHWSPATSVTTFVPGASAAVQHSSRFVVDLLFTGDQLWRTFAGGPPLRS